MIRSLTLIITLLQRLQLHFYFVNVGESDDCRRNNIRIYDGPDTGTPLVDTLCGIIRYKIFLMTHNEAFVILTSDGSMMTTELDVYHVAYEPVEGKTC